VEQLTIGCPYCGEVIDVAVEKSTEEQNYYEDCSVCCCPILFIVATDNQNHVSLVVKRDDE